MIFTYITYTGPEKKAQYISSCVFFQISGVLVTVAICICQLFRGNKLKSSIFLILQRHSKVQHRQDCLVKLGLVQISFRIKFIHPPSQVSAAELKMIIRSETKLPLPFLALFYQILIISAPSSNSWQNAHVLYVHCPCPNIQPPGGPPRIVNLLGSMNKQWTYIPK